MLDPELKVERSVLLLVDMQNGFLKSDSPFIQAGLIPSIDGERQELVLNTQRLVGRMRQVGRPVVYITTAFRPDNADCFFSPPWRKCLNEAPSFLAEGSEGAAMIDGIRPKKGDFVLVKKGHSSFQHTYLDRLLSSLKVDTCVYVGNILGSMDETLRQGAALGYDNILVEDSSYPLRSAHLKTLVKRAFIVPTDEVLGWIGNSPHPTPDVTTVKPCLIIVDIQNDYLHPEGASHRLGFTQLPEEGRREIIENNLKLAAAMRAKGFPVVYIKSVRGRAKSVGGRDNLVDTASSRMVRRINPIPPGIDNITEGTWGAEIVDEVKPQEGDYVVVKRGHSAFGTTHLHRFLRNLGANLLLFTGGSVTGCLSDSCREGIGLGYRAMVVADATYQPVRRIIGVPALASRAEIATTDEALTKLDRGNW